MTGGTEIELLPLDEDCLEALLAGDLRAASERAGAGLPSFFLEEAWLWRIRLRQRREDPSAGPWVVRAARLRATGEVVGHAGFHGPPDADGVVEVAYTVVPERRGQGLAGALLAALLERAAAEPRVRVVRASVSPGNEPSLRTLRRAGFVHVGEQVDEEDGLELVLERPAR